MSPSAPARRIDLNADVGEGHDDAGIFPWITSASIACGAHAGDATTMADAIRRALATRVAIGAHPGFPDRAGFGRSITTRDPSGIEALVHEQICTLADHAARAGAHVEFVKPHGALYNLAAHDRGIARAIVRAVLRSPAEPRVVFLAGSPALAVARTEGALSIAEAFVDRRYLPDGSLAPRGEAGAVIGDSHEAAARALTIAEHGRVSTLDGHEIDVAADTLCLHGDSPGAAATSRAVHEALLRAGFRLRSFAAS